MDLGIRGRRAIVCAASKGLGKACARSLARQGVDVTIVARTAPVLDAAAEEIRRETDARVTAVAADVTTPAGRAATLAACRDPDILINNAGGPPVGDFRNWSRDDWIKAIDANMLTAIELIKATVDGMMERRFGRIVNITSSTVKAPVATLDLSNGARAGLTGFCGAIARQTVRYNVTINGLLPGSFATDRLRGIFAEGTRAAGKDFDSYWDASAAAIPAGRFGDPAEFGDACAYLCSAQAGYITGQNLLIDGGEYPGTL